MWTSVLMAFWNWKRSPSREDENAAKSSLHRFDKRRVLYPGEARTLRRLDGRHRRWDQTASGGVSFRHGPALARGAHNPLHRPAQRHLSRGHQDRGDIQIAPNRRIGRVLRRREALPGHEVRRPRGHCHPGPGRSAQLYLHKR